MSYESYLRMSLWGGTWRKCIVDSRKNMTKESDNTGCLSNASCLGFLPSSLCHFASRCLVFRCWLPTISERVSHRTPALFLWQRNDANRCLAEAFGLLPILSPLLIDWLSSMYFDSSKPYLSYLFWWCCLHRSQTKWGVSNLGCTGQDGPSSQSGLAAGRLILSTQTLK
jgi:hypothetical protein